MSENDTILGEGKKRSVEGFPSTISSVSDSYYTLTFNNHPSSSKKVSLDRPLHHSLKGFLSLLLFSQRTFIYHPGEQKSSLYKEREIINDRKGDYQWPKGKGKTCSFFEWDIYNIKEDLLFDFRFSLEDWLKNIHTLNIIWPFPLPSPTLAKWFTDP